MNEHESRVREALAQMTPGEWQAVRLVHDERGDTMTPEEVGEYVKNTVIKSAQESGSTEFLAVVCEKQDGPADICHVGNGPTSAANCYGIAVLRNAALAALDALRAEVERLRARVEYYEEAVCMKGNPLLLPVDGTETEAIQVERVAAVLDERETLRAEVAALRSRAERAEAALERVGLILQRLRHRMEDDPIVNATYFADKVREVEDEIDLAALRPAPGETRP